MAFFNRETIMPQVMDTYGPYQDMTSKLDQSYDTAQNRAAQKINQIYGSAGMNPSGAPASAAKARSTTDIENQRAQQSYQSYYDWLRGKQLATPQIQPSGISTLAAPFVSGMGAAAGPKMVDAASRGLGSLWGGLTSGIGGGIGGALGPNYGMGSNAGYEYTPAMELPSAYGDVGAYADVMGTAPSLDWNLPTEDLFNFDFGNVWGL